MVTTVSKEELKDLIEEFKDVRDTGRGVMHSGHTAIKLVAQALEKELCAFFDIVIPQYIPVVLEDEVAIVAVNFINPSHFTNLSGERVMIDGKAIEFGKEKEAFEFTHLHNHNEMGFRFVVQVCVYEKIHVAGLYKDYYDRIEEEEFLEKVLKFPRLNGEVVLDHQMQTVTGELPSEKVEPRTDLGKRIFKGMKSF